MIVQRKSLASSPPRRERIVRALKDSTPVWSFLMRLLLLPALLAVAGAAPALAGEAAATQQGMRPPERENIAEMQARLEQVFDRLDADRDDVVTSAEIGAAPGGRLMMRADSDGDGRLTRDEMREGSTALFKAMDRDGDGVVTADERPR